MSGFNGAGSDRSRKVHQRRDANLRITGFNGAGSDRSRKVGIDCETRSVLMMASMGPGVIAPGKFVRLADFRRVRLASMGPGVIAPGKGNFDTSPPAPNWLQWGRE